MVQQVDHSLLFGLHLPLALPDSLLDAKIQVSRCFRLILPEVCQISVSEMPKWGWLFEALLESVPYLFYYLTVLDCIFKSVPSSCKLHRLLPQVWGPTASPQGSGLPRRSLPFAAWRPSKRLPCLLPSSSSPDTSPLVSTACLLQLDGPFRTTKENWMRDISATTEDSNLTFGMHWGMLRQCPLVMAYRGRTDRDWIIEVTMCCPERTK